MKFFGIGKEKQMNRKTNPVPFSFIAIFDCITVERYLEKNPQISISTFLPLWLETFISKQGDAIIIRDSAKTETLFLQALDFMRAHKPESVPLLCNHRAQNLIPNTSGLHYKRGSKRSVSAEIGYAGVSAHSGEGCIQAESNYFDYVFLSPVFETSSHPGQKGIGLDKLSRICATVEIPVFALGGITEENRHACKVAGAKGTASISLFMPGHD
jgi:thiamine-phosphate pyrophosphorylase